MKSNNAQIAKLELATYLWHKQVLRRLL